MRRKKLEGSGNEIEIVLAELQELKGVECGIIILSLLGYRLQIPKVGIAVLSFRRWDRYLANIMTLLWNVYIMGRHFFNNYNNIAKFNSFIDASDILLHITYFGANAFILISFLS